MSFLSKKMKNLTLNRNSLDRRMFLQAAGASAIAIHATGTPRPARAITWAWISLGLMIFGRALSFSARRAVQRYMASTLTAGADLAALASAHQELRQRTRSSSNQNRYFDKPQNSNDMNPVIWTRGESYPVVVVGRNYRRKQTRVLVEIQLQDAQTGDDLGSFPPLPITCPDNDTFIFDGLNLTTPKRLRVGQIVSLSMVVRGRTDIVIKNVKSHVLIG